MKKRGIKILDELKLKAFYATGYLFLGELYADKSQNDKALETLKKNQRYVPKDGNGLLSDQNTERFGSTIIYFHFSNNCLTLFHQVSMILRSSQVL